MNSHWHCTVILALLRHLIFSYTQTWEQLCPCFSDLMWLWGEIESFFCVHIIVFFLRRAYKSHYLLTCNQGWLRDLSTLQRFLILTCSRLLIRSIAVTTKQVVSDQAVVENLKDFVSRGIMSKTNIMLTLFQGSQISETLQSFLTLKPPRFSQRDRLALFT